MKKYSKVSMFGMILSAIAMLISGVSILYSAKSGMSKGPSISIFCCMVTIFGANVAIAENSKINKNK
ncbi:MAG TPA: hypothetical protein VIK72_11625 [Clostridiaceae bacterium]